MTAASTASTLNPCPDCAHPCSYEARSCPNCGKPYPHPKSGGPVHDDAIYAHLLNHSAVKVGSCLTLLGLIKAVEGVKEVVSVSDELLAIAAMSFIVSGAATYIALKNHADAVKRRA